EHVERLPEAGAQPDAELVAAARLDADVRQDPVSPIAVYVGRVGVDRELVTQMLVAVEHPHEALGPRQPRQELLALPRRSVDHHRVERTPPRVPRMDEPLLL